MHLGREGTDNYDTWIDYLQNFTLLDSVYTFINPILSICFVCFYELRINLIQKINIKYFWSIRILFTIFCCCLIQEHLRKGPIKWKQKLTQYLPYISVYKSRNLSQNKILHRQFVLYTGNTPLREEIIPKASWIFKVRAHHDSAVVSDNARIDEFSIAPLVYHLYTNPFLCYSWDIIL